MKIVYFVTDNFYWKARDFYHRNLRSDSLEP